MIVYLLHLFTIRKLILIKQISEIAVNPIRPILFMIGLCPGKKEGGSFLPAAYVSGYRYAVNMKFGTPVVHHYRI